MDHAVSLVQSYLYVNGFLTVAEHPVLEVLEDGHVQTATDIDIVAYRTPRAGGLTTASRGSAGREGRRTRPFRTDPALELSDERAEMLIVEVKQGRAELNRGATNPAVLEAVLHRFGCCASDQLARAVGDLGRHGEAVLGDRLRVRLVAFGATIPGGSPQAYRTFTLGHVVRFLEDHLRRHWPALKTTQVSDPAFGFLMTLEKARRSDRRNHKPRSDR